MTLLPFGQVRLPKLEKVFKSGCFNSIILLFWFGEREDVSRAPKEIYTRNTDNKVHDTRVDRKEQEKHCLVKMMTETEKRNRIKLERRCNIKNMAHGYVKTQ